uniref:Lymphocyte antigen 6 complex locus G6E n=1 Tax=Rattus norvegicus TaxID=10116 RepID=A0A1L6ZA29_RAT|nr:lymphocyte antigen 6 complex locus G6E [Rattus norvegicus]
MGLSSAFLGLLFLSGTLGKGRLGSPQGAEGWDWSWCKGEMDCGKGADRGEEKRGDFRTLGI